MARSDAEPARQQPRLYLVISPASGEAQSLADAIQAAGKVADIAAVLVRPAQDDSGTQGPRLAPLVTAAHAIGAACLIENNTALALSLGADGAHLDDLPSLKAALPVLRPHGIAGAGGLRTKHDAMSAGEAGADYVMFGEPDAAGRRPAFDTVVERTEWWAQLFEPPCVAYAATLEEVEALTAAGADFIALGALLLDDPQAVVARLAGGGAA